MAGRPKQYPPVQVEISDPDAINNLAYTIGSFQIDKLKGMFAGLVGTAQQAVITGATHA